MSCSVRQIDVGLRLTLSRQKSLETFHLKSLDAALDRPLTGMQAKSKKLIAKGFFHVSWRNQ